MYRRNAVVVRRSGITRRLAVGAGEELLVEASVVLEINLGTSVGIILYDGVRLKAAAGALPVTPGHSDPAELRERVQVCSLSLLVKLLKDGSSPESIEVFALGMTPPAGGPLEGKLTGSMPGAVSLAHGPPDSRPHRRAEFDVSRGRLVMDLVEHA
jgi:hypothetical protein